MLNPFFTLLLWILMSESNTGSRVTWRPNKIASISTSTSSVNSQALGSSSSESLFLFSLSTYLKLYGDLYIPVDYTVPTDDENWPRQTWDFPLGSMAQDIRYKRNSRSIPVGLRDKLNDLGFIWDTRMMAFDDVYKALVIYKREYGDLLVPQAYTVPHGGKNNHFDESLWGLKLGIRVRCIREAHQFFGLNQSSMLDRLGFAWGYHDAKKEKMFRIDLEAMKSFKKKFNSLDIPLDFFVPNSEEWPKASIGLPLGKRADRIRSGLLHTYAAHQTAFLKLGLTLNIPTTRDHAFRDIYDGLLLYKEIFGDLLVPRGFVIPNNSTWPKHMWNIPLGIRVGSIRAGNSYFDLNYAAMLDKIDFVWDVVEYKFEVLLEALKLYKRRMGNMYIPQSFCISKDDLSWPEQTRGLKLGRKVKELRQGADSLSKKSRARLDAIGFAWQARSDVHDFDLILRTLVQYKELLGDLNVPVYYVVPIDDNWPADVWSVPLGQVVQNIRHGKTSLDEERKLKLQALGFLFKDIKRELYMNETISALAAYKKIYGHTNVPTEFEVPTQNGSWPKECGGLCLGSRVKAIRQRKFIVDEQYIPQFEKLDFAFNLKKCNQDLLLDAAKLLVVNEMAKGASLPIHVSSTYIIPNDTTWPAEFRGYRIGTKLRYLRKVKGTSVITENTGGTNGITLQLERLGIRL